MRGDCKTVITSSAVSILSDDWRDPHPQSSHHYQFHLAPGTAGQSLGHSLSVSQIWFGVYVNKISYLEGRDVGFFPLTLSTESFLIPMPG